MNIEWNSVMRAVTTKLTEKDVLDMQMFETNIQA
jgi:hypothetical protein